MPTSTFYNLPPPKRNKLLRAAVAEFAQKPFDEVSINRIIQAAEIPRGAFTSILPTSATCSNLCSTAMTRS